MNYLCLPKATAKDFPNRLTLKVLSIHQKLRLKSSFLSKNGLFWRSHIVSKWKAWNVDFVKNWPFFNVHSYHAKTNLYVCVIFLWTRPWKMYAFTEKDSPRKNAGTQKRNLSFQGKFTMQYRKTSKATLNILMAFWRVLKARKKWNSSYEVKCFVLLHVFL